MAACFQLTPKGSDCPESLAEIDRKICEYFGAAVSEKFYFRGWYDAIGFSLAMGRTFAETREELIKYELINLVEICDYLSTRYTANSFNSR